MHMRGINLGPTEAEGLFPNRSEEETPEFDITAMVDLVFLMNLYFLVTFLTVAMGKMALPSADHASPLNSDTAVVFNLARSLDGESIIVRVGDDQKSEPIGDTAQQEKQVQAAIEEGVAEGKEAVLLKAEANVRLADLFRISSLVSGHDLKLHVAVMERDK
jgi:biopolymer transport protein ExbD